MRWILAYVYYRRGDFSEATAELKRTLDDADVPEMWRGRHEALLATLERLGEDTVLTPAGLHPLDDAALSVPNLGGSAPAVVAAGSVTASVALNSRGSVYRAYAANGLSDNVSVIDLARGEVTGTIPVGAAPWGIVAVP